jgi:hypothetical protein
MSYIGEIEKTGQFSGLVFYRTSCQCGSTEHDLDFWLELEEEGSQIVLWMEHNLSWRCWQRGGLWERLKAIFKILFRGELTISADFYFRGEDQIRGVIAALEEGIAKVQMAEGDNGENKPGIRKKRDTMNQIILPQRADKKNELDFLLISLVEAINRINPEVVAHGILGGEHGYGADYENDVFVMRPYVYDAECSCGFNERAEAWHEAHPHSPKCYSTEVNSIDFYDHEYQRNRNEAIDRRNALPWLSKEVNEIQKEVIYWDDKHREWKESVLKDLCKKHNIPWNDGYGCMIHCDCGKALLEEKYFRENDHLSECELCLPNFLHKKSGYRVEWYKWIGRDMKVFNPQNVNISDIFAECEESLRGGRG